MQLEEQVHYDQPDLEALMLIDLASFVLAPIFALLMRLY